jgi:hypothetical protein
MSFSFLFRETTQEKRQSVRGTLLPNRTLPVDGQPTGSYAKKAIAGVEKRWRLVRNASAVG